MFDRKLLSKVAQSNVTDDMTVTETYNLAINEPYDKETNPNGVLNLGVAVNKLQEDIMLEKLNSINQVTRKDLEYGDHTGSIELRTQIANTVNRHFNVHENVNPNDIVVVNGCTAGIDVIASVICDPGDAVLVSTPYYYSLEEDVNLRVKAVLVSVPIPIDETQEKSQVKYYEEKFNELESKGIKTKMIILCNPHNPLGKNYSREALESILEFANKHKIFVLMDEIYALSVYRGKTVEDIENIRQTSKNTFSDTENNDDVLYPFISVLSFDNLDQIIDPSLVIVIHGLSKDFCLNGFRLGWIISPWNKRFTQAAQNIGVFSYQAIFIQSMITKLLSDTQFIDSFINLVNKNLLENYTKTTQFLTENNIKYVPAQAGLFICVNLGNLLIKWKNKQLEKQYGNKYEKVLSIKQVTFEDEFNMWVDIVHNGRIYITSGFHIRAHEPGWARLIFAIPWEQLKLGLERLIEFVEK
ncbi:hypothetical protein BB558_005811 [Smittium angustum]|uniref:Aminotransferase class I/classII large domain-containing protein n=2 Tax=Smittium angustum TaxID=133377 RepID=A0A2U1IZC8_SMIAN|nr:hypothetical protein BB558_005811 [Smittium angustum]